MPSRYHDNDNDRDNDMFTMNFKTENAAFADDPSAEAVRILRAMVKILEDGGTDIEQAIVDVNGNNIGDLEFKVMRTWEYQCYSCDTEYTADWYCGCDSDCPECGDSNESKGLAS